MIFGSIPKPSKRPTKIDPAVSLSNGSLGYRPKSLVRSLLRAVGYDKYIRRARKLLRLVSVSTRIFVAFRAGRTARIDIFETVTDLSTRGCIALPNSHTEHGRRSL